MHVLSAGMKATSSEEAVEGCEILRRACGGHGYSNVCFLNKLLQIFNKRYISNVQNYHFLTYFDVKLASFKVLRHSHVNLLRL